MRYATDRPDVAALRDVPAYHEEPSAPIEGPVCADNPRLWIPEGEYQAICGKVSKFRHPIFKREIVALQLRICDGEHQGVQLERFYPWTGKVGRNSGFWREWTIANGTVPSRRDRLSMRKFVGKIFLVRVATVQKSWDGARHGPGAYSKVAAILELIVTNERTSIQ